MSHLGDEFEAEEVGKNFRNVVDHWGNTKECRSTSKILEVPEEKCENEADAEAHKPGDEEEGATFEVGKMFEDCYPLRDLSHSLGKHLCLQYNMQHIRIHQRSTSFATKWF